MPASHLPAPYRVRIGAHVTAALAAIACVPVITHAQQAGATPAAPISLRGIVYDSLSHAPLAGATVQAVRADNAASARSTTSDSSGAFQLDSIAPGRYLLGFLHPTLDLLAVQVTPVIVIADGRTLPPVTLAVPGPTSMRAALCPPTTPSDSSGAVAGVVRNALTGDAASGATVVLSWEELGISRQGLQRERRRVPTTLRADGSFLVCGVPTDTPIDASATGPGVTSGLVEIAVPMRGLAVQRFALGPVASAASGAGDDSAAVAERGGLPRPAPGTARLAGRVVGPDSRPMPGARVRVWGTDARAETGVDGRYTLSALPTGTFTVEVRGIALEPFRAPVDLANGQTAELTVTLHKPAAQLERVSVVAKTPERTRFLQEFEARRRSGQGRYFTADDIAKAHAVELTDVIRGVSTLNVMPRGARGNVLVGRRNCIPTVWLDGNVIRGGAYNIDDLISAQAVAAIEVYGGGAALPAQFNPTGTGGSLAAGSPVTCGAVVIWTAR